MNAESTNEVGIDEYLSHDTLKPRLEPLDRIVLDDFMRGAHTRSSTAATGHSGTGSSPAQMISTIQGHPRREIQGPICFARTGKRNTNTKT